jgi:hypothetical protein
MDELSHSTKGGKEGERERGSERRREGERERERERGRRRDGDIFVFLGFALCDKSHKNGLRLSDLSWKHYTPSRGRYEESAD